jgi:50S ribosomal protein L16 3-hydroxylase
MIAQSCMDIALPTALLGALTPQQFMRRHWQKKPLLIRAAMPGADAVVDRAALFALAARAEVESRLVVRDAERWSLRHGPFGRRALPPLKRPAWTLLVQGADLHLEAAHRLLARFRFVPDARLDDLMFSYATDGGGVGPHIDSYDVFLLQVRGRRRWRIARLRAPRWRDDVPLKMLAPFDATDEWLLEAGDMLYLPPGWAHDGSAEGETITASIGFRAAGAQTLGVEVVQQMLDAFDAPASEARYADRRQPATATPARIPPALQRFADAAAARVVADRRGRARALGEALSEPKPGVRFEPLEPLEPGAQGGPVGPEARLQGGVRLDRRTRMLYDDDHVFINGEAFRAGGRDARTARRLADRRELDADDVASLSAEARALVDEWVCSGWLHARPDRQAVDRKG